MPTPTAAWPSALPASPLRSSLGLEWPETRHREALETGSSSMRRGVSQAVLHVEQIHELSRDQYELWRAWHRHELREGAEWFSMPLFLDSDFVSCSVRLLETPRARPRGAWWRLPLRLETYDPPVIAGSFASSAWPEELPYAPVPEILEPVPHEPLLRSDEAQAGARVRRRFSTPARLSLAWDWSLSEFALFRAWFRRALHEGVRWFLAPVWSGNQYRSCACRWDELPSARLRGGVLWRVSGRLEIRLLETLTPGELAALGSADALHHLVHVTAPAAVPA